MLPAEVEQALLARPRPGRADEGHRDFSPHPIGHADHRRVRNPGVPAQQFLDLARINILAAADNHVLEPAEDAAIARLVHRAEVTGVQPAVAIDRAGGRLRVVEIALHHGIAASTYFAGLSP